MRKNLTVSRYHRPKAHPSAPTPPKKSNEPMQGSSFSSRASTWIRQSPLGSSLLAIVHQGKWRMGDSKRQREYVSFARGSTDGGSRGADLLFSLSSPRYRSDTGAAARFLSRLPANPYRKATAGLPIAGWQDTWQGQANTSSSVERERKHDGSSGDRRNVAMKHLTPITSFCNTYQNFWRNVRPWWPHLESC